MLRIAHYTGSNIRTQSIFTENKETNYAASPL